jgi:hypothetical protein
MAFLFETKTKELDTQIEEYKKWKKKKSQDYLKSRKSPFRCSKCGRGMTERIWKFQKYEGKIEPTCNRCYHKETGFYDQDKDKTIVFMKIPTKKTWHKTCKKSKTT